MQVCILFLDSYGNAGGDEFLPAAG